MLVLEDPGGKLASVPSRPHGNTQLLRFAMSRNALSGCTKVSYSQGREAANVSG